MPFGKRVGTSTGSSALSSAIQITESNSAVTAVTGSPTAFVNALVDNLVPVETRYAGDFSQAAPGEAALLYSGTDQDFRFELSGSIISDNPSFLGGYVGVKIVGDLQGEFTGGLKFYPVGVSFGASQSLGFSITVYGRFPENEIVRLQLSADVAGDLQVVDCIYYAQKIIPDA